MIALLTAAAAWAATVNVQLCGTVDPSYTDVGADQTHLQDDFVRNNAVKPARGATVRVWDLTTSVTTYYTLPDPSGNDNDPGTNPACTGTVQLNDTHLYNLRLVATFEVGGNTFEVRNDDTNEQVWAHQGPTAWTPVAGVKTLNAPDHAAWRVGFAAAWALHRRNGGVTGEEFVFYTQDSRT
jgi:hypothetical protein